MKLLNTNKKFKPPMTINVMVGRNVEIGKLESVQICDRDFPRICEISMGCCVIDPIGIPAPKDAGLDEEVDKLVYKNWTKQQIELFLEISDDAE